MELEYKGPSDSLRLDKFLVDKIHGYSRSYLAKKIKDQAVLVNGLRVKPSYLLEDGDKIKVRELEEKLDLIPEKMNLDIIYEDDSIIVLNKPRGLVVHPGKDNERGTLVNALLAYTDSLSDLDGDFRPGIVHRLDKNTEGLLVVAKNNESHEFLKKQLMENKMKREYLALVEGQIYGQGQINQPIGRDPNNRMKMTVIEENSKPALTFYEVLENFQDYTYIKAGLFTGRMHQIRVHMSYLGHPVLGDSIYGSPSNDFNLRGQLLCSYKIGLVHPLTKEYMEFENKPSKDLLRVLNILRKES